MKGTDGPYSDKMPKVEKVSDKPSPPAAKVIAGIKEEAKAKKKGK